jgi:hypothetical protein
MAISSFPAGLFDLEPQLSPGDLSSPFLEAVEG